MPEIRLRSGSWLSRLSHVFALDVYRRWNESACCGRIAVIWRGIVRRHIAERAEAETPSRPDAIIRMDMMMVVMFSMVPVPILMPMSIHVRAPIAILIVVLIVVVVARVVSSAVVESSIIEAAIISAILRQSRGHGVDSQQRGDEECETYLFDLFQGNSRFQVSKVEPKPELFFKGRANRNVNRMSPYKVCESINACRGVQMTCSVGCYDRQGLNKFRGLRSGSGDNGMLYSRRSRRV